ncbi:MAG: hypothetical protein CVU48_04520 [Candidatus Cloacimonetes bacterium HGW-Cloacimonetes-1]|jgi:hypothetical protein|nr:MAG: hypothetical protein CVU48_04520 [Candidatus Cloacimonetes bacterium HGW-Cloacimonetes-1]
MIPKLNELINAYPDSEGAKALRVLTRQPNTDIHCINLTHFIDPPDYSSLNELLSCELSPEINPFEAISQIPMTDHQAIREIYSRLNHLLRQKAEILGFDPNATTDALDTEITALKRYVSQCLRPGGKIRNCNDEERRASQRISVAIKRLLQKAEADHPEAVAIVRNNLKMGLYFRYEELN